MLVFGAQSVPINRMPGGPCRPQIAHVINNYFTFDFNSTIL